METTLHPMHPILVFGTICLDRMRKVAFLPGPGGYVAVQEESVKLGGEAANTAYALAQWGAPIRLVGNAVEQRVQERLTQHGLSLDHVSKVDAKAPVCDIYVTPDGQRTMFGVGFDKMAETMNLDDLDFAGVAWFTMDMNFGELGWEAARLAGEAGIKRYIMDAEPEGALAEGDVWQSSTDWVGTPGHKSANLKWAKDRAASWGLRSSLRIRGARSLWRIRVVLRRLIRRFRHLWPHREASGSEILPARVIGSGRECSLAFIPRGRSMSAWPSQQLRPR